MTREFEDVVFALPQEVVRPGWTRVVRGVFSSEECDALRGTAERTGRYYHIGGKRVRRDVWIRYLHAEQAPWAFERLAWTFVKNNIWGFALGGIVEPFRIQKYGPGGFTRPHSDFDYTTDDQSKITAIVPLIDRRKWRGGRLFVAGRPFSVALGQGDCVLFPSFAWHWVTPVTDGERIVLSAWAAGPRPI